MAVFVSVCGGSVSEVCECGVGETSGWNSVIEVNFVVEYEVQRWAVRFSEQWGGYTVEAGFDVIDVNFGCPVKKVLGKCRGGYLLTDPETALEIVSRVRQAVPPEVPVTVKMRLR